MRDAFIRREVTARNGNRIIYYTSPLLDACGVPHMFSTRHGGISGGVFSSLNFAAGAGEVRDTPENIIKNHSLAAGVFGLTERDICRSYQTHSANVEIVGSAHKGTGISKEPFLQGVDGLVTKEENIILSVRTADCVPVLLYDKKNRVCAAVHAGWRGTLAGIAENAIEKMRSLEAHTDYIAAAIGPCAGACCYEVGGELRESFVNTDKAFGRCFEERGSSIYMDLTAANLLLLMKSGIKWENISAANLCTCCNGGDFFSHRRDGSNRGTMSALIVIK